jgi:hypothetical protein
MNSLQHDSDYRHIEVPEVGATFGNWKVLATEVRKEGPARVHGFPCHCCWGVHRSLPDVRISSRYQNVCSYENPACPCHRVETIVTCLVTCRCLHTVTRYLSLSDAPKPPPVIRIISLDSLLSGKSRSCGHCRCSPEGCARPWLFESDEAA